MTSDQCITCKHYLGLMECEAYKRIPQIIFTGEHDHAEPYKNDNGIRYEPLEKEQKKVNNV